MAPVGPVVHHNASNKIKRPIPPGIQTNGAITSAKNSPSPLMSAKKPPLSAKQPPHSASERAITASTVRPVNRARRETSSQVLGRNSRNSAGLRSASLAADMSSHDREPQPYIVTDSYILRKFAGRPPSLIVHMHATHFRFDKQDGMFPYKSPMRLFLDHVRSRTVPHDLLEHFTEGGVPFYDGCLIVQVHDHKSVAEKKDTRPVKTTSTVVASSIHNYNQYLTPSPYVPFPKECLTNADGSAKVEEETKDTSAGEKDIENSPAPPVTSDDQKGKGSTAPKIFTVVLHPTPESLHKDLIIKALTPRGASDALGLVPPSTPISLVPPTPTTANMPPPAKRQKRERMEVDGSNIREVEGQILLATNAPLMLEPTKNSEEMIALLEAMSHPKHSEQPPQPKTRKRTVAEVAADEAAAAEQERYMLVLDERLPSGAVGAQNGGVPDGDAQTGAATFEPRFERFKVIADIKREHAEKKEQEKIKQQENDRRLQQQRQQQQQEAVLAAQRQQAADQERARREAAAAREAAQRQAEAQRLARAAAATPSTQTAQRPNMAQPQHGHPTQNGMVNNNNNSNNNNNNMANGATGTPTPVTNGMSVQAQPRFQAQISQPPASSPVARQGTPQNMSSPMVGSVPMQQTNSGVAASPPRPSSVVQNHPMSVPMAHNMSSRGSQQSHPSGTPRIPHSTPNIPHGTPINRAMAGTPRMTQASPPPNMMAQNSQMGQAQAQAIMMSNQAMNQANPQVIAQMAAQQRAIAQQQQQQQMAAMQNGIANGNMNGQAMSPQQQQQMMQMMQRQMMLQQQQQQQHSSSSSNSSNKCNSNSNSNSSNNISSSNNNTSSSNRVA
ncbi:Spt20 family-domain-containing protein [Dactylonectria macrodidyma]|uniref:Spt20 family-domain-containing protein n=1 Tax=Dactylonectria macrodidyma TaxID=307937 RepID=A0A9P9F4P1_9HYPO|nr:Spt20 family-domain-containing protein [Dactylonectria macrodidyma]